VSKPTFEQIQPLVEEYQIYSPWLYTTFVCPQTGYRVTARAEVRVAGKGQDLWDGFKSSILGAVGYLMVAMTGDLTKSPGQRLRDDTHSYREQEVQGALLEAFLSVRGCFRFDGGRWVAKQTPPRLSALEELLRRHPISGGREAELLTRCLSGMAALDGQVLAAERQFLERYAPAHRRLPEGMPELSELSEIRPQARPTVFLLAQTLAMVDEELAAQEEDYLARLAAGLELAPGKVSQLRRAAGEFVLEQSLRRQPDLNPEQMDRIHRLTGLPVTEMKAFIQAHQGKETARNEP
jgi:hypothetical protein